MLLHLAHLSLAYASNFFQLVEKKSSLMESLSVDEVFSIPLHRVEFVPKAIYFMLIEVMSASLARGILDLQVRDFTFDSRR